jgi:hypothetical protein
VIADLDWPRLLHLGDALGVQVWRAWGEGPPPRRPPHLLAYARTPSSFFSTRDEIDPETYRGGGGVKGGRPRMPGGAAEATPRGLCPTPNNPSATVTCPWVWMRLRGGRPRPRAWLVAAMTGCCTSSGTAPARACGGCRAGSAVVVDRGSPLAELDWAAAGVRPTLTSAREMAAVAGGLFDAVTGATVRHRGQVELTRGVLGAKQRPMVGGQAFGWDRHGPGSSTMIAASLALWGVEADTVQRPRRRRPGEPSTRRVVVM